MALVAKILLGLAALALVIGLGFYLWLVIAFEPPKPKPGQGQKTELKAGALGEGAVFTITAYRATPGDAPSYTVATGLARDETGPRAILVATGSPKPVDARVAAPRRVEVVFDGPLADGRAAIAIDVGEDYASEGLLVLRDGRPVAP